MFGVPEPANIVIFLTEDPAYNIFIKKEQHLPTLVQCLQELPSTRGQSSSQSACSPGGASK